MTTEAEEVAKLAKLANSRAAIIQSEDGRTFLIKPNDCQHVDITEPNALPLYEPLLTRQVVQLQTVDSLVEYVNRFKGENTVLFADINANMILGAIDYHAPDHAGHMQHKAPLQLSFSTEWDEWGKISGTLMPQLEFARFIEENAADIAAPPAADLLECVRDLQAHRKVNFTKAVRTSSENENFEFTDETEAKGRGGIEIPTRFVLKIPVYFGESDVELGAFLRWKLDGGLFLGIKLHRTEHVRQAVFQQIVLEVASRTERAAVFGTI